MMLRVVSLHACAALLLFSCGETPAATAAKVDAQMGEWVDCNGVVGTVEMTPSGKAGDDSFYTVQVWAKPTPYQLQCPADKIRIVPEPGRGVTAQTPLVAAAPSNPPAVAPVAAAVPPGASNTLCVPGAKLEGQYGNSWYEVTVRGGPDARGWCPVSYDGYGEFWDGSVPELRPRGAGPLSRPVNPVPDKPAPAPAGKVADGSYDCSKIVGGGGAYRSFGIFTIRNGQVTGSPFPNGWTVLSVTTGAKTSPRGESIVEIRYRTASGNTDLLDCTRQ